MIQGIVEIAAIDRHDGTRWKREPLGDAHIVGIPVGDERPAGQTALVIELQMQLNRPLGPLKPGPIEHRRTQFDDRGIQRPQGMLEAEPPAFGGGHRLTLAEHLIEERLVQLPRSMGIGIRQRGARRRPSHAEVDELAEGRGQATTDLAERMRAAHLTEQHATK